MNLSTVVIAPELMDKACQTEGESYNTGLRLQDLEVWAIPPHQYRHYTEFFLLYPVPLPCEVKEVQDSRWAIGYTTPDGVFTSKYIAYSSEEEAQARIHEFGLSEFYATCPINVFYTKTGKADGSFTDQDSGIACGVVLLNHGCRSSIFDINVSSEEAESLLTFRQQVQAEWESRAKNWRDYEAKKLQAVAEATASEGLKLVSSGLLECLECGATYAEAGHVEFGGMSCDRCG